MSGDVRQMPLEIIEWHDHCSMEGGNIPLDQVVERCEEGPILVTTVGFVVHETDVAVSVTPSVGHEEDGCMWTILIIKGCIVSRKALFCENEE